MTILKSGLRVILQEHSEDFTNSLRLPPYWIIQHAIDEKLLEEYCACLEEMLSAHMAALSVGEEC